MKSAKRNAPASLSKIFSTRFRLHINLQAQSPTLPDYERKQTLSTRAFHSPELKDYERKILAADERILKSNATLHHLRQASHESARLRRTPPPSPSRLLASFAKIAADRTYIRPESTTP